MAVELISSWPAYSAGTPLTSGTFTPQTGDLIVVKAVTETYTHVPATPSGGGWTYSSYAVNNVSGNCWTGLWVAPVTTGGTSQTVSIADAGMTSYRGAVFELWRGAQLDATPATAATTGSGAPLATLSTEAANSVVSWCNGDWSAQDGSGTGAAYRSSATQEGYDNPAPTGSKYGGYWAWQAAATSGSQNVGLTAPTGQTWAISAIEIQATAGGASAPAEAAAASAYAYDAAATASGQTSGPNYGGAASDLGGGSGSWANPGNAAGTDDATYATWSVP